MMIARRHFFRWLLKGALATTFAPVLARAETKSARRRRTTSESPTPPPGPENSDETPSGKSAGGARLRLWKATDTPDQPIQVRFLLQGKPDSDAISPFQVDASSYQFSNYVAVPTGVMSAEVSMPGRTTALTPLQLADGGQSTLLIRAQGPGLTAEWIDDTPGPVDNGCEFGIYNLLPASGEIQIDLGTILTVHLSSSRSCLRLTGIKRANYTILINGADGSGKNFRWNTEADFRQYRKATLLIYPDAYGRIRPRINGV